MSREDRSLPKEYRGSLDLPAVIATLDALDGEVVCLNVGRGQASLAPLDVAGALRRLPARAPCAVFAIGDAGYLSLGSGDFKSATLSTLEGNFYFILTVELRQATVRVGDPELVGSDLSDPDSPTYIDPDAT